jgi:hypothetical protein
MRFISSVSPNRSFNTAFCSFVLRRYTIPGMMRYPFTCLTSIILDFVPQDPHQLSENAKILNRVVNFFLFDLWFSQVRWIQWISLYSICWRGPWWMSSMYRIWENGNIDRQPGRECGFLMRLPEYLLGFDKWRYVLALAANYNHSLFLVCCEIECLPTKWREASK